MALNEGRSRTGMRWRTEFHANINEDVKFFNPKNLEESCTLFECMENGNFEEKIEDEQFVYSDGVFEPIEVEGLTYKNKFLQCSKCDRIHYLKKHRSWNTKQKNRAYEEYEIRERAERIGCSIEEATEEYQKMKTLWKRQEKEHLYNEHMKNRTHTGYNSRK